MERFSGIGADFVYNLFPTLCTAPGMNLRSREFRQNTNPPMDPARSSQAQEGLQLSPKFSAADFCKMMLFISGCAGVFVTVWEAFLCGGGSHSLGCALWILSVALLWAPVLGLNGAVSGLCFRLSSCGACGALGLVPHARWHMWNLPRSKDKTQSPLLGGFCHWQWWFESLSRV